VKHADFIRNPGVRQVDVLVKGSLNRVSGNEANQDKREEANEKENDRRGQKPV